MIYFMSVDYCADLLRRVDYPLYVALLVLPRLLRPTFLPLFAFNAELTHVPHAAQEPMLRNIRYQWWREAVERLYSNTPDAQPVMVALAPHKHIWDMAAFDALVGAHEEEGGKPYAVLCDMALRVAPPKNHMTIKRVFDALATVENGPLLPLRLWWRAR